MSFHNIFGSADAALVAALNKPFSWPQSGLEPLPWFPFTVAASRGATKSAARVARRTERAYWHLRKLFGFTPRFRLLVLDATDWAQFAQTPTYGVTHLTTAGNLVVGTEPAAAWHEVGRDLAAVLPTDVVRSLIAIHGRDPVFPEVPDLTDVADTLIAHELAHVIAEQAGAVFARRWEAEAFANYALVAVLGETDSSGLHRVGSLADAAATLADITPSVTEFESAGDKLSPLASVLVQLALTRGVFAAYADAYSAPLARWFAAARRAAATEREDCTDDLLGRLLARDVHPALGRLCHLNDDWHRPVAKAA